MLKINSELIDKIVSPGQRLPWIKQWLMDSVWSQERYEALEPLQYLNEGESCINKLEELIASTADRMPAEDARIPVVNDFRTRPTLSSVSS